MPINKFKFVSPGVQVAEIDNSQLPAEPTAAGPVIIGRAERGPAMQPTEVNSFSEFVTMFGMPWPGRDTNDIWRNGNKMAPSYGVYAAQAYLRNSSPLTFVRLLGKENADAVAGDQAQGAAGWQVGDDSTCTGTLASTDCGGNYALFLFDSATPDAAVPRSGTLAAVWYCESGAITLEGDGIGGTPESGTAGLIETVGDNWEFTALVKGAAGTANEKINFNLNRNSQKYIRKVFNTNPTTINERISAVSGTNAQYWLGETYEREANRLAQGLTLAAGSQCGMILRLATNAAPVIEQNKRTREAVPAESGWVVGQYLGNHATFDVDDVNLVPRLFKVKSQNAGAWESQNFKISIADIAASTSPANPYGTFTVEVRKADDSDAAPEYVERFGLCNLNPTSPNYVGRKVGDRFKVWDADAGRYREYGDYPNQSKYVYVQVHDNVANSMLNEEYVPFGFEAPSRWKSWAFDEDSTQPEETDLATGMASEAYSTGFLDLVDSLSDEHDGGGHEIIWTDSQDFVGHIRYPQIDYREASNLGGLPSPSDAYFGYSTGRSGSINNYEESNIDVMRAFPFNMTAHGIARGDTDDHQTGTIFWTNHEYVGITNDEIPSTFTLDDLSASAAGSSHAQWVPGSKLAGTSLTVPLGADNWTNVLSQGFSQFTMPFFGGFDGENIVESNPFNSQVCQNVSDAELNYAYNSVKMAIDTVADPELVNSNLMSVPGNYCEGITNHLLTTCEKRADSLAVMDLLGGYVPNECAKPTTDATGAPENRGSIAATVSNLQARGLNSSYGTAYYPWVQLRDGESSQMFYAPPSIAAIGTYSSAQNSSEVWFAPAGFTRGGLTEGSAGIPVVGVSERLSSTDRDTLYDANINPIATFPAEGIVVFGQKTLQVTPSALDRVNVRRLMIYVKKEISKMAATLLFDQNVASTWARFTGQANPFLESIKQRLGLEAYKVVLDTSTTTPDLIDRNIMYAKIFLKPARAIEFIAIDFVITNAGASFED
jgi:phage tail sheath protein FI